MKERRKLGNPKWKKIKRKEPWIPWMSFGVCLGELSIVLLIYAVLIFVYQDSRDTTQSIHAFFSIFGFFILSPLVTWRMLKRIRPKGKPFIWF